MISTLKRLLKKICAALLSLLAFNACDHSTPAQNDHLYEQQEFKDYWYAGNAELNSYDLDQSRYGENRKGKAMLIFVTEGFSKNKQVKLDDPESAGNDKVSVMKLNFTKNFVTGIYPYSMMLSVFTPIVRNQFPNTMKVTMSTQEWCGHVFTQMNLSGKQYNVDSYSYFEQEGDKKFSVPLSLLEDEIFNQIRIDPKQIPTGKVMMTPGLFFTRMQHENLKPKEAEIVRSESGLRIIFEIKYPERSLRIEAENTFPYKILGWEETFRQGEKLFNTKATLDKTLVTDYWRKNKSEFIHLRDSLGLSHSNY